MPGIAKFVLGNFGFSIGSGYSTLNGKTGGHIGGGGGGAIPTNSPFPS